MFHHLFRLDWNTVTYDEMSPLSSNDRLEGLRLNPLPDVAAEFSAARSPLVVAKPLVESQSLDSLLVFFPDSKAIWMYRHFADVAASNLKLFGPENGHNDLKPILANDPNCWRSIGLSDDVRDRVRELYSPDAEPHDAAALFWYARNSLFLSQDLANNPDVALCRYDDLVEDPVKIMTAAYRFIGRPFPGSRIVKDVLVDSRGKGRDIRLSASVRDACQQLLDKLDSYNQLGG